MVVWDRLACCAGGGILIGTGTIFIVMVASQIIIL
jgi:hypothetical protein